MIKIRKNKIGYFVEILVIGIMIFSSISFLFFFFPSRLFQSIDFYEIKIGIPFTFFHEYRIADREVLNSWYYYLMIIDFIFSMILSILFVNFIKFRDIHKNKIIKNLFVASIYSVLLFFSISYFELIKTPIIQGYKYNVGFPFKYFDMFWLSGNYFPNHGTNPINFIKDAFIIWLFCLFVIGFLKFVKSDKTETLFQK